MISKKKITASTKNTNIVPKTFNQQIYCDLLANSAVSVVIGTGPAGSGKTFLACKEAVHQLMDKHIDKIVITRPVVSVDDEQLGFLPGSMNQKMDPWTRPIFDVLSETFSKQHVDIMLENDIIEIAPLAYMRGRTFKRTFIIADEMQNSSPNQMLMLLTRLGEESKLVITGDIRQSDRPGFNGLADLIDKLKGSTTVSAKIKYVEMNAADIQRSEVLKEIIQLYE